jgi:hypothetical protein
MSTRSNPRTRSVSLAAGVAGGMLALLGFAGPAQASVDSAFDAGSGTLTVTSNAGDGIAIACQGSGPGQVIVNGAAPGGGPANCDAVTKIIVTGGPGANALDLRGVTLANDTTVDLTDKAASKEFRELIRQSACNTFSTVLGPGSDDFHKTHIHLDLIERKGGYRICRWDAQTVPEVGSTVPPERPHASHGAN